MAAGILGFPLPGAVVSACGLVAAAYPMSSCLKRSDRFLQ